MQYSILLKKLLLSLYMFEFPEKNVFRKLKKRIFSKIRKSSFFFLPSSTYEYKDTINLFLLLLSKFRKIFLFLFSFKFSFILCFIVFHISFSKIFKKNYTFLNIFIYVSCLRKNLHFV